MYNNLKINRMNREFFTGVAFSIMLFLLISCNTRVQESPHTVSVSGIGTVLAQPDMALVNVYFSHTAPTTKEAKRAVEETMRRILQILQEEKVEDNFIKTVSLSYDMEYDYRSGRRVRLGQRAQQMIVITLNDMINRPERFPSLLDKITTIDRVEVHNIQFDIENKTELYRQSRELAYQKAYDKAIQYAALSGRKIGKVMTISEGLSRDVTQTRTSMNNFMLKEAAGYAFDEASSVPAGERGVTSEINITFSLE
jgi:uncharacterized protein YggE